MEVTQIPFNKFIEISNSSEDEDVLKLQFKSNMENHLGTFHASAQYALAEACSGLSLQKHFPHLAESVVPVLRKSDIKFKQPAKSDIQAKSNLAIEEKERFEQQLEKKGCATIAVPVEVMDKNGIITMVGKYEWFIQKIKKGL